MAGEKITRATQVLALLAADGAMTRTAMALALGMHRDRLSGVVTGLLKAKQIHVAAWDREGYPAPIYALGDGPAARKPAPRKRAEIARKYRTVHGQVVNARRRVLPPDPMRQMVRALRGE